MKLFDRAVSKIEKNWKREYNCIPFTNVLPRFSEYVPGIMQNSYTIITASSKVGKTQFTDNFYLYHAYDFVKNNPESEIKLKILYNSLEMDLETKIIQGIGRKLFLDWGLIVPHYALLSMSKNRMNTELFEKIMKLRKYFEEFEDIVEMTDEQLNPTQIYERLEAVANLEGETLYKEVEQYDRFSGEMKTERVFSQYVPKNPNLYVINITDHRLMWLC